MAFCTTDTDIPARRCAGGHVVTLVKTDTPVLLNEVCYSFLTVIIRTVIDYNGFPVLVILRYK